ncbi:MAG TPA: TetR/AcrR family transcriptional regulator [Thermodesulfobacteriota bacterium]|nr:TetR/AcrR family transcriptional regulator [Thermodesulfobacteriota bacterium]
MPTPMNAKAIDPGERIQSAALKLFIRKGITGTTTKEIARKAGVSEGSIYNYFESKGDLAYKLFVRYMDEFRDVLSEKTSSVTGPEEKLSAAVRAFFGFAEDEPDAYAYIMIGHYTELRKMPYDKKKPRDIFVDIIGEGIREGVFTDMDENLGAAFVIGMVTRVILFRMSGMLDTPYGKLVEETAASSLRVLGCNGRRPL